MTIDNSIKGSALVLERIEKFVARNRLTTVAYQHEEDREFRRSE
jgi:hypothetical protein